MGDTGAGRIRALTHQAEELLEAGRSREASLVFGRVLLDDPDCEAARIGLERARVAVSEDERRIESRFDEAARATLAGNRQRAREILEGILEAGGDRDRAAALLDRLDERAGVLMLRSPARAASAASPPGLRPRRTPSRRAFGISWTLLVASLAFGLGFGWENLVSRLLAAPAPKARATPPATRLAEPEPGELRLAEARRLLEAGEAARALAVLDEVVPSEAAYPFARQLRAQAEAALRQPRGPS